MGHPRFGASVPGAGAWLTGDAVTSLFCDHFETEVGVEPPLDVCSSCVEMGDVWVHLRQCLACGRTSCCNESRNKHATAHFRETGHPMIRTAQPDEDWRWCYVDDRLYAPGFPGYPSADE